MSSHTSEVAKPECMFCSITLELYVNKIYLSWWTGMFPRRVTELTVVLLLALVCQGTWDSVLHMVVPLQAQMTHRTVWGDICVCKIRVWTHFHLAPNSMHVWVRKVSTGTGVNRDSFLWLSQVACVQSPVWIVQELESTSLGVITCSLESRVGHMEGGILLAAEIIIWLSQPMNHSSEGDTQWEIRIETETRCHCKWKGWEMSIASINLRSYLNWIIGSLLIGGGSQNPACSKYDYYCIITIVTTCYGLNYFQKVSSNSVPNHEYLNLILFGKRLFVDIIKRRSDHTGLERYWGKKEVENVWSLKFLA